MELWDSLVLVTPSLHSFFGVFDLKAQANLIKVTQIKRAV